LFARFTFESDVGFNNEIVDEAFGLFREQFPVIEFHHDSEMWNGNSVAVDGI